MNNQNDSQYNLAFLDIETFPNLGYTWGKWEQNVIKFEREWTIASFAVKWMGEKTIESYILPDFPLYQKDPLDDTELIKKLWEVFNKADLIVAHNGDKFDIKKANSRFIINGLKPPRPPRSYDTLKVARKIGAFTSNKLDDLCEVFGIGKKLKHEGFEMWFRCLQGDEKWWKLMRKYNIHDVVLLEKLYYKLRPWDPTHPNITLASGKSFCCPVCGSSKTVQEGHRYLKSYRVKRYSCSDCGHFSSGAREKLTAALLN